MSIDVTRRDFLAWFGVGTSVVGLGLPLKVLAAADPD